jgi:glycosyltransferase involved in cell wall biosynthesis
MKVGIIIPWFGRDLKGGAEQQAWQIASRLAARGHEIEVLTTCCRSHQEDWGTNHLVAGTFQEPEGFLVRRFPVDPRDRALFDRVCADLLRLDPGQLKPGVSPVSRAESEIFAHELIKSEKLMAFLSEYRSHYDSFLFLPYLYGPILQGIEIVRDRAILQPCLHDEAYAYLPQVAHAFYRARRLFFNSEGEQELALRLFGPAIWKKSHIIGEGVEVAESTNPSNSGNGASNPGENGRYLLYLGRKDPGKNTPLLLRAFGRFRAVRPNSNLALVLAGTGSPGMATPPRTVDFGVVSNEKKGDLLRHCLALVQPSQNESFSRVMMEAWFHEKPVAVHARCGATAIPVRLNEGGWLADSEDDWAKLFVELDRTPDIELRQRGENGKRYAAIAADWEKVMDRYEAALSFPSPTPALSVSQNGDRLAINQFLPNLSYGDAISNQVIWIRDRLREAGLNSDIFVHFIDPKVASECRLFNVEELHRSTAAIYHHSIGADMTAELIKFPGPKCLVYHNITPGHFFQPYRPAFAQIVDQGRKDLAELAKHFKDSVGVSVFNANELAENGFHRPGVLPLPIDVDRLATAPDPDVMGELQDGRTNILFVGRFAPNKKQDDLIAAFAEYLRHDPEARLILVGRPEQADRYMTHVLNRITELDLAQSVLLPGTVDNAQLAAYYRTAHLFWSMSEHEGFCVPLIEAMFQFSRSAAPPFRRHWGVRRFCFQLKRIPHS